MINLLKCLFENINLFEMLRYKSKIKGTIQNGKALTVLLLLCLFAIPCILDSWEFYIISAFERFSPRPA